jgi:hypothetical protein
LHDKHQLPLRRGPTRIFYFWLHQQSINVLI